MLYVAFERAGSGAFKPSKVFHRTYLTTPHVKSAVAMRAGAGSSAWTLDAERPGVIAYKPVKGQNRLYFVDVESVVPKHIPTLLKQAVVKPANGTATKVATKATKVTAKK
jgi:hypothetical protein